MMAKLNKTTHLMILFTFAIVFIVIYLYYTIGDVKKMNSEVRRLVSDVSKLNQDVQNILAMMPKIPSTASNLQIPTGHSAPQSSGSAAAQVVPAQSQPQVQVTAKPVQVSKPVVSAPVKQVLPPVDDDEEDEASSVNTEELKRIINDVDDEVHDDNDVEVEKSLEKSIEETLEHTESVVSDPLPSEENLKKLKAEEIKDLCRARGLSTRGSKEQLIAKLVSI